MGQKSEILTIFTYHLILSFNLELLNLICHSLDQALRNCMYGYDHACNVHINGITHARKFVHGIDLFV